MKPIAGDGDEERAVVEIAEAQPVLSDPSELRTRAFIQAFLQHQIG